MKKIIITIDAEANTGVSAETLLQLGDALAVLMEHMKLHGEVKIEGNATVFPITSQLLAYIGVVDSEVNPKGVKSGV
jgi:hypothetical protein